MSDKIKISNVEILWSECSGTFPKVGNLRFINAELRHMSAVCGNPKDHSKGYDKTAFKITYEDGETYEGRIDVVEGLYGNVIKDHIEGLGFFYMGKDRPRHMSEQDYLSGFLLSAHAKEMAAMYEKFLSSYSLTED